MKTQQYRGRLLLRLYLKWLHVKYLLSIFTADCLRPSYPDGGHRNHMGVAHSYCNKLLINIFVSEMRILGSHTMVITLVLLITCVKQEVLSISHLSFTKPNIGKSAARTILNLDGFILSCTCSNYNNTCIHTSCRKCFYVCRI